MLGPGSRIVGVTKGQFGLTEMLGAVLRKVCPAHGPASVMAWAWSMAPDDARMMAGYRRDGLISEMVVLFDRSFPTRHPDWVPLLYESLGRSIYATNNHAKVVLVRVGSLRLVIQSSMNFNINRRFEHFSVEDEPELFTHWERLTRWMMARTPAGLDGIEGAQFHEAFKGALVGPGESGGAGESERSLESSDSDEPEPFNLDALLASLDAEGAGLPDLDALLEDL